ncbi:MAG: flippase [Puia sp.]|nr:flippase [Puia sp.]
MTTQNEIRPQHQWVSYLPGFIRSRLAGRHSLHAILSNAGWLLLDRVVRMGVGVIVTVLIARYLGPNRFGSLNFAMAFVALFGTITSLGLDMIIVREVVRDISRAGVIVGTALTLRIGASFLAVATSILVLRAVQPHDRTSLALVSILSATLVLQAFDTLDAFFQSQVQSRLTVWAKNSAFLLMTAWRLLLIRLAAPLWTFAAAQVIELTLGAIGMLIGYYRVYGTFLNWRYRRDQAVDLLRQSWPVIMSSMAIMIYMRIDMVMLKVMQGDTAVGLYSAAARVSEVWYFIPSVIVSSVSPAIIRAKPNPSLYYGRLRQLFCIVTLVAVVIGSAVAMTSHLIIRLLYSSAYEPASAILSVHIWASIFVFQGVAQSVWDFSEGLLKLSLYRTVAGAILNIGLNLFLIPRFAGMGAAVATVIAYSMAAVFGNIFSGRTRPIFYMQMKAYVPTALWRRHETVG